MGWEVGAKLHGIVVGERGRADQRERIRLLCWLIFRQVSKNYWVEISN